jgi:hypothetical protein
VEAGVTRKVDPNLVIITQPEPEVEIEMEKEEVTPAEKEPTGWDMPAPVTDVEVKDDSRSD